MNYIFQTLTRGYFASNTDYYRCALAGQPLSNCEFANVSPGNNFIQSGNRDLKFENGKSWGYGVVWSPASAFTASVDYWNMRIDDLVTNIDEDTLLRIEADCRAGTRDINSTQCTDALTRIQRNPADAPLNPNAITTILVNPINAAFEQASGIDASATAKWQPRRSFVRLDYELHPGASPSHAPVRGRPGRGLPQRPDQRELAQQGAHEPYVDLPALDHRRAGDPLRQDCRTQAQDGLHHADLHRQREHAVPRERQQRCSRDRQQRVRHA